MDTQLIYILMSAKFMFVLVNWLDSYQFEVHFGSHISCMHMPSIIVAIILDTNMTTNFKTSIDVDHLYEIS